MNINPFRRRFEPDHDDFVARLREVKELPRPADEFAPPPAEYSIDRVRSFLSRHIKELEETELALATQALEATQHLIELERRRDVTKITREALAETIANLTNKCAALDVKEQSYVGDHLDIQAPERESV